MSNKMIFDDVLSIPLQLILILLRRSEMRYQRVFKNSFDLVLEAKQWEVYFLERMLLLLEL